MTNTENKSTPAIGGIILRGIGGLYEVLLDSACETHAQAHLTDLQTVICRARGAFRHSGITPLPGDRVRVVFGDSALIDEGESAGNKKKKKLSEDSDIVIDSIYERKNFLIRPPLANLDVLFIVIPAAQPAPVIETADKLISIAEHNEIEPVIIITKSDLAPDYALELRNIYKKCGFDSFCVSSVSGEGVDAVMDYILRLTSSGAFASPIAAFAGSVAAFAGTVAAFAGSVAAFAGASGAGKSTLMNCLFPQLKLLTGTLSRRIERGKHTTREVSLYQMNELLRMKNHEKSHDVSGYLADTPGFSMLDFTRFDFFRCDQLPFNFREFAPYLGKCKYSKCTHSKEEGCLITEAVKRGDIPKSRHDSYLAIYDALRQIPDWKRKSKDEKQ